MTTAASITNVHGHDVHHEHEPSSVGLPNLKLAIWLFLVSEVMFFAGLIGSYVVLRFGTEGWPNPYNILAVRITAFNTFLLICSSVTMVKAFQWSDYGNRRKALAYLGATILGGATFVGIQIYEYGHLLERPSTALLHHVEHLMHEHGVPIPGHADEHASADSAEIVRVSQDAAPADDTAALLTLAYERLHDGRPEVRSEDPNDLDVVREWDAMIFNDVIVPLRLAFPDDKHIQTLGMHHNLYPEGFVPGRDVFTSTFYVMTGFHGAHVSGGVIWLIVLFAYYAVGKAGTVGIEVAGLYWHFVDLVWIILFTIVYLM